MWYAHSSEHGLCQSSQRSQFGRLPAICHDTIYIYILYNIILYKPAKRKPVFAFQSHYSNSNFSTCSEVTKKGTNVVLVT